MDTTLIALGTIHAVLFSGFVLLAVLEGVSLGRALAWTFVGYTAVAALVSSVLYAISRLPLQIVNTGALTWQ